MSAYPPQRHLPSVPVSQETALSILQAYLTAATTTPHLLPNSVLTPTGPTAQDAESNLTIHNLKRVEAGLRGEWLAPELEIGGNVAGAQQEIDAAVESKVEEDKDAQMGADGWQSLEEYQREQSDIEGEIGARMPTSRNVPEDQEEGAMDVDVPTMKLSKEERKAAKKARHKEEKKAKARSQG